LAAVRLSPSCCTVHAEVDALLKVATREEIKGSTVYVVRVNKRNELAMSKPCEMCAEILREHGVKRAFFSVSEDENAYGVVDFR
jgi:deoxycytidylate deaminase